MYKISLLTRDGASISFDAEPTDTLLDAAEKAKIYPPSVCREGGCGSCRVTVKAGAAELADYSKSALSDSEREAGDILLCRAKACADLELVAPFDRSAVGFAPVPERRAKIVELALAGAAAMRLVLKLEDDPAFGSAADFTSGQFMELSPPGGGIKRAYSIASAPNWDGTLEFLIRLQPEGLFSTYLREQARPGDVLALQGPQGSFTIDEASATPRWFVAGGTGLAPILSMLRHMAEFGDTSDCRLFFGVNNEEELFAQDAIAEAAKALPALRTTVCVWRPGPGWRGFAGTPVDALAEALAETSVCPDLYVCGPPALVEAATKTARARGVARERVFSEQFAPA